MNLAALIDAGVDSDYLKNELKKLNIGHYEIKISQDIRNGISGTRVDVIIEENPEHQHEHRSFSEIKNIIQTSELSAFVKEKSIAIFRKLAEAEGKIHNKPVEEVHFHEIGAIDSIVDIVGASICIDYLKPSKIITSRIELGSGMVKCSHGIFPVPAPATIEVLKGIPVKSGNVPFEATTPTGAAILATLTDEFSEKHNFTIKKTGYGIGHKDGDIPNVLRVLVCKQEENKVLSDTVSVIECNIDDMNPEVYDYLFEKLFNEGALDVFITPIIMKKSRPANILSVVCDPNKKNIVVEFILKETSSLGVRMHDVSRVILNRGIKEVETSLGKIKVKHSWLGSDFSKYKPEYDDCIKISKEKNIPLINVMNIISHDINDEFSGKSENQN